MADPKAAIDALAAAHPALHRPSNLQRLLGTLQLGMAHPEGQRLGIGEVDDARLARGIALIANAKQLPHVPTVAELFTRALLPADGDLVRSLARPVTAS